MPQKADNIPPLAHAVGGSLGSALALLLLYPLERARIEVQTVVARLESNNEEKHEKETDAGVDQANGFTTSNGVENRVQNNNDDDDDNPELLACFQRVWERGELYKGAGPLTWTLATSSFVFFFVNAFIKEMVVKQTNNNTQKSVPPSLSLLGSCLAGSINVLITNPLWVTNLRIISNQSTYPSLWKELFHVARTLGLGHLWQGTTASLLLVSNPVIQFFCYEQIKGLLLRRHPVSNGSLTKPTLSPVEAFLLGALAKAAATLVTYPLQLAQAVLRMQKKNQRHPHDRVKNNRRMKGILQCLLSIYARDGFRGLYTGMRAKLLQTVLTAAFTFLTYEQILSAVYTAHRKLLGQGTA